MSPTAPVLDLTVSINEIVAKYPAAIAVFNRYGIDSCCGGAVSVDEAARRDGVDAALLCSDLQKAIAAA